MHATGDVAADRDAVRLLATPEVPFTALWLRGTRSSPAAWAAQLEAPLGRGVVATTPILSTTTESFEHDGRQNAALPICDAEEVFGVAATERKSDKSVKRWFFLEFPSVFMMRCGEGRLACNTLWRGVALADPSYGTVSGVPCPCQRPPLGGPRPGTQGVIR